MVKMFQCQAVEEFRGLEGETAYALYSEVAALEAKLEAVETAKEAWKQLALAKDAFSRAIAFEKLKSIGELP